MSRPMPRTLVRNRPSRCSTASLMTCSAITTLLFSPSGLHQVFTRVSNDLLLIGRFVTVQRGDELVVVKFFFDEQLPGKRRNAGHRLIDDTSAKSIQSGT